MFSRHKSICSLFFMNVKQQFKNNPYICIEKLRNETGMAFVPLTLNVHGGLMDLSEHRVMGILNVTPDSFYAASRTPVNDRLLIDRVRRMLLEGASIIDVGACSTRPGSVPIDEKEELFRLHQALSVINEEFPDALLSVDTFRAAAAREAVREHGVAIINDVSAGAIDTRMFETVAELQVPYVLTHNPLNEELPSSLHGDDFLRTVFTFFARKISFLQQLGVNDVVLDPGFGFGKTVEQNYLLMRSLADFKMFELPLLVGVSRKSMICKLLGVTPEDALNGTSVLNTFALLNGTHILRVHDVKQAVESIQIVKMLHKNGDVHVF